ncbi:endonuclease domain-containing protein [Neisseria meningitidis]|uniref:endonuclease domain-containing protein n=1 Tax=Neisseria meningitidis TaxID=487 RepID=UPI00076682F1|nr:endonuclease domain-containing protein [Neisseria meningitidis]CWN58579.1 putative endonuclease [Neisseria meningitidis]CWR45429.1 putative endonuclease [Neisseria meningitidis]
MNPHEKLLTTDNPILRQRAKAMRQEMSGAEAKLWQHLRAGRLNGYKFRRHQPMGNYIVDFMCVTPKLIVEADGGQHTEQAAYDHARTAYLNSLGFTVLRFWNHEILQQTNDVLTEILLVLQELEKQAAR